MARSLFDLLTDTFPIHAAMWATDNDGSIEGPGDIPARLAEGLEAVDGVLATHPDPGPPALQSSPDSTHHMLWAWEADALHTLRNVTCRVRAHNYARYLVFEEVEFGRAGKVLAETADGSQLELALSADYLVTRLVVRGGEMAAGSHTLWPLAAKLDSASVAVLVYEIDRDDSGAITGVSPLSVDDDEVDADTHALLAEVEMSADVRTQLSARIVADRSAEPPVAMVGEQQTVQVLRERIVVALCFSTCRERSDFEPAGVLAAARVNPHIMVTSSIPLASFDGTVRLLRPGKTMRMDGGCGGEVAFEVDHEHANAEIRPMLTADTNQRFAGLDLPRPLPNLHDLAQKGFWAGTFAYVMTAADERLEPGEKLLVVNRAKTSERKGRTGGVRHFAWRPVAYNAEQITKVAGQGEFDNIHLAATMKMPALHPVVTNLQSFEPGPGGMGKLFGLFPVPLPGYQEERESWERAMPDWENIEFEQSKLDMDVIWQAPFCDNDCLHMHWRWGRNEVEKYNFGWDSEGPYRKPGAPMVPLYQDVEVEVPRPSEVVYTARSDYRLGHQQTWDVMMHHGCAYALAVKRTFMLKVATFSIDMAWGGVSVRVHMADDSDEPVLPSNSHPMFYWTLRYDLVIEDGAWVARERVEYTDQQLLRARML